MKVQVTYKGKTVEIDIPDEELDELVKEQKKTGWEKTGWEKPESDEYYYVVSSDGNILKYHWRNIPINDMHYKQGNCFTSKEFAESIARYQSLDFRIRRRISEICNPVDLCNPNVDKYTFYYDNAFHDIGCVRHICVHYATWYCDTEANAYKIIEEFKDELTWYFTEFKDRMDG